ncbi:MAG TPA: hypothetical protein VG889_07530 [Rhizomicrobium sp.]|nr:hypothetical protein [Rhizomicrobium sp.]
MARKAIVAAVLFCAGIATAMAQQTADRKKPPRPHRGDVATAPADNNGAAPAKNNNAAPAKDNNDAATGIAGPAAPPQTASPQTALAIAKVRPEALRLRALLARRVDLKAIEASRVPVLVIARPEALANLQVFVSADHYTASTRFDGATVEINGTVRAMRAPDGFKMPSMRTVPLDDTPQPIKRLFKQIPLPVKGLLPTADALRDVSIEQTSYGEDISFSRFGNAVYNITMDCGGQAGDPEAIGPAEGAPQGASAICTENAALGLAKGLVLVGGGAP